MAIRHRLLQGHPARRMQGVTLLELMIVVVVIAIITAVAFPSYRQHVVSTKRADGKAALMSTAQQLERCYTRFSAYNNAGCGVVLPLTSPEGEYVVSSVGAVGASAFTLAATPQGPQAEDAECGVLRLTSTGAQGSQGASTDANGCW
ncbi:MAG: type IV pilin protein [Woeseiaceae bacterium]